MSKSVYHVGLAKAGNTLIIQAARSIDYLSCEIYDYLGQRETTKASLHKNRYAILDMMKARRPDVYKSLKFAIVE